MTAETSDVETDALEAEDNETAVSNEALATAAQITIRRGSERNQGEGEGRGQKPNDSVVWISSGMFSDGPSRQKSLAT